MKRALIVDPAFLGDVVFDGPLARALVEAGYEVGIVIRPPAQAVAVRLEHVTHVHVFDKRGADAGWTGLARTARAIAGGQYAVAYVPHPSVRSTLLASRAKIPVRIGSAPGRAARAFLTEHREPPEDATFVDQRLHLFDGPSDPALAGVLKRDGSVRDKNDRPRIGLVLGSEWATKRWPVARAREFVDHLGDRVTVVWIGAAWERELYEGLPPAEDRTGGTVEDLLDAIASCDLVIGGDTGPVHMARGMGIPVVALFGPTFESRHAFVEVDRVLSEVIECRPCSAHGDKACPLDHHLCLAALGGTRVAGAVIDALGLADQS